MVVLIEELLLEDSDSTIDTFDSRCNLPSTDKYDLPYHYSLRAVGGWQLADDANLKKALAKTA